MKTADRLLVLLAFVLEPPSLPGEREEPTSRIILIVRVGRLAPQEISPRSRSDAPTIWDLACEGVTFTQVELPDGGRLTGRVMGDPGLMVQARYSDPDGTPRFCHNTEVGSSRFVLFERGRVMDEYLSVPEYYGEIPSGEVISLAANPTVSSSPLLIKTKALSRLVKSSCTSP